MKGKLFKTGNDYLLKDTNGEVLAITNGITDGKKLSKQNCNAIFGVVDIEKLAEESKNEYVKRFNNISKSDYMNGFEEGFNKAMELNKDKLFTIEDIRNTYQQGEEDSYLKGGLTKTKEDNYIQSLQQPTEIDVEIKMEPCFYDQSLGGFSTSYTEDKPKEQPKLDEKGCLILKKL